jgi:hypothetical protein
VFCSDPALMGCWPMDEGSGAIVNDGSSHNNNGAITGASWAAQGDGGFALSFSGTTSQYVSMTASASLNSPAALTLEAWIRPSVVGTDGQGDRIIDKDLNVQYALSLGGGGNGHLCFSLGNKDTCFGTIPVGTWTHVGGTWAGGTPIVYVDGSPAGTGPNFNGPIPTSPQNLQLGDSTTAPSVSTRFQGEMRGVRIYSRAKTAAEMCAAAGHSWSGTMCQ